MNVLRGIDVPPLVVAAARGIVEAAVMAGLIALASALSVIDFGDKTYLLALLLFLVREAEGLADHIDPARNRAPDETTP